PRPRRRRERAGQGPPRGVDRRGGAGRVRERAAPRRQPAARRAAEAEAPDVPPLRLRRPGHPAVPRPRRGHGRAHRPGGDRRPREPFRVAGQGPLRREQGSVLNALAFTMGALLLAALRSVAAPAGPTEGLVRRCLDLPGEEGVTACQHALSVALPAGQSAALRRILAVKLADLERWEDVVDAYREGVRARPAPAA